MMDALHCALVVLFGLSVLAGVRHIYTLEVRLKKLEADRRKMIAIAYEQGQNDAMDLLVCSGVADAEAPADEQEALMSGDCIGVEIASE